MYQTLALVFDHVSKHRERELKNEAQSVYTLPSPFERPFAIYSHRGLALGIYKSVYPTTKAIKERAIS